MRYVSFGDKQIRLSICLKNFPTAKSSRANIVECDFKIFKPKNVAMSLKIKLTIVIFSNKYILNPKLFFIQNFYGWVMNGITECFLTLGLKDGSSPEEVKAAYHKLARRYHPDANLGISEDDRAYYEERFKSINQAYNELLNYFKDRNSDHFETSIAPREQPKKHTDHDVAKAFYMKGLVFFREKDINNALDCFLSALRKDKTNPHYIRMVVKCLLTKDRRLHEAKEYALKLLQIENFNGENYYLLGKIYHKAGLNNSALSNLKKAQELGFSGEDLSKLIEQLNPKNDFKRKVMGIFSKK